MIGGVRVLIFNETDDEAGIEAAYHEISRLLAPVPGLLSNELLRSVHAPNEFVVLSHWESMAAFRRWEEGADHHATTAPLRPFRDTGMAKPFGIYRISAAYHGNAAAEA